MTAYALIANPASGRGRAIEKAVVLSDCLCRHSAVQVLETTGIGSARRLAADLCQSVDRIFAIGGDGTLNEVLNGVLEGSLDRTHRPALGFIPAGTGNAAARALRSTTDPRTVAEALSNVETVRLDVGLVRHGEGERAFLLWMGAGLDAVVIEALHAHRAGLMGLSGLIKSVPEVVRAAGRYAGADIEAVVDDSFVGHYASLIVANFGQIPFGGSVTDGADPRDGALNVVGVPRVSHLRSTGLAFRMLFATLTSSALVVESLGSRISIRSSGLVPIQADGEPIGCLPAEVSVLAREVEFLRT